MDVTGDRQRYKAAQNCGAIGDGWGFLARAIRSSGFVQVPSVTGSLVMVPLSDIIFDAASAFDDYLSDSTSAIAVLLFATFSAVQAVSLTAGSAMPRRQAMTKILRLGEFLCHNGIDTMTCHDHIRTLQD